MFDDVSKVAAPRARLQLGVLVAMCAALLMTLGCQEDELEPTDPEGAFQLFSQALQERDADEVWAYLDKDTRKLFSEHYRALVRMDKIIEAYFDPAEHRDMRERTGAYIVEAEKLENPKALYHYVFNLERKRSADGEEVFTFTFDEDEEVGLSIDEFKYDNEEDSEASIVTRGGQTFKMIKEEDGIWRTASLWSVFNDALSPIAISEANLRKYAEENLDEERDRRKAIVAFFYERTGRTPPAPRAAATPPASAPAGDDASPEAAPEAAQ